MICFDYTQPVTRGDPVEVLLSEKKWPRSGVPREVVDRLLAGEDEYTYTKPIFGIGIAASIIILCLAIQEVLRMKDNGYNSAAGWKVLFAAIAAIWGVSAIFAHDQFFKRKRYKFDSARPMILTTDHEKAQIKLSQKPADLSPFSFKFHEFAGHARISGVHGKGT